MNLIRTEQQVALNELLVAVEKSADHLRDAAAFLDEADIEHELIQLAERREQVAADLRTAIRASGDLPSAPDPDTESSEKLLHRISAFITGEKEQHTLQQRLNAEESLAELTDAVRQRDIGPELDGLIYEVKESIREVKLHLQNLLPAGK